MLKGLSRLRAEDGVCAWPGSVVSLCDTCGCSGRGIPFPVSACSGSYVRLMHTGPGRVPRLIRLRCFF